ncbi:uncharacterized protein LOC131917064 [Peromyscus eremicus]|uniref:uncharacterized protein LOC131917064 n=1 Tax=Peromyscus eremicus TaxID=42410 RepID=UPI0027DE7E12|nr:uncharacterized protein LOC131917064 [Peromyscus eremicus]
MAHPIPGANWPRRGTALGGQLRQPASRKEADPPSESIQSAGAGGKTQQYGSSGEAGGSGSVANAGEKRQACQPAWKRRLGGFSVLRKCSPLQTPADLSQESPAQSPRPGTLVCLHRILATADSKLKARGRGSCQSLFPGHSDCPSPPSAPPAVMCLPSGSLGWLVPGQPGSRFNFRVKRPLRAFKMTGTVKVPAAKPDHLSSVPRTQHGR